MPSFPSCQLAVLSFAPTTQGLGALLTISLYSQQEGSAPQRPCLLTKLVSKGVNQL